MPHLGYLNIERLENLPQEYWAAHEFCFRTHDQMAQLLVEYESSGAHHWVTNALQAAVNSNPHATGEIDLFDLLKSVNLQRPYKHHVVSHLVLALTSDLLHFLYEALCCFEKRKFAVGFALLRKPLKENLLFLSWILGDTEDFIARFEANNHKTLGGTLELQRLDIFGKAISRLQLQEAFSPDLIHDLIFSKTNADGFEPVWQRASHLITSQGTLLRTSDYEINFVFNNPASDDLYDLLYSKLPYALIFTMHVVLESFSLILKANERTVSHLMLSTMGCYEALFLPGKNQHVAKLLNKHLKPFLKCIHCRAPFRLNRKNSPMVYLREIVVCQECGLTTELPLYWLLSMADTTVTRSDPVAPILGI